MNANDVNKPLGMALAKVKNNYLLAQNQQGLLIVQLTHALQYITQQQIDMTLAEQGALISKPVLIPFNVSLNNSAESWLGKHNSSLKQLGFEFALLGENEIMVRQVPAILHATDIKESIKQFVNNIQNNEADFMAALIEIIVNNDFSNNPLDWNKFLRDLEDNELEKIKHCYHQISDKDLSSWFKK